MADQFTEIRYKGRIIIIGVKWSENPGHHESHFTIWEKQRDRWEIVFQGHVKQLFDSKEDALYSGKMAAQSWVDEHDTGKG